MLAYQAPNASLSVQGALQGKVAMITEASDGIGRALALHCARAGAALQLSGHDPEGTKITAEGARALGAQAAVVPAHGTRAGDVQHLVERCCAQHGRLDVAFNQSALSDVPGLRYQLEAMWRCAGAGVVVNLAQSRLGQDGAFHPCRDAQHQSALRVLQGLAHTHGSAIEHQIRLHGLALNAWVGGCTRQASQPIDVERADRIAQFVMSLVLTESNLWALDTSSSAMPPARIW